MTGPAPQAGATAGSAPHLAVVMACHNRREKTLRALGALAAAQGPFRLTVVLLDDASTDGTGAAVRAAFPDTVILDGDGAAFWNGGMHRAWAHATTLGVDGYLWLNDDVALDGDALARLAAEWQARGGADAAFILVGATRGPDGTLTYGGQMRVRTPLALRFERLPAVGAVTRVDTFNGNIVLVSQPVVARIGINDPGFRHALGDLDYGLRATAAGVPVLLMPGTLGLCEANTPVPLAAGPWKGRLRRINSHRGLPFANWWRMTRRWSGIWLPAHFLLPYRRLFLPSRRG